MLYCIQMKGRTIERQKESSRAGSHGGDATAGASRPVDEWLTPWPEDAHFPYWVVTGSLMIAATLLVAAHVFLLWLGTLAAASRPGTELYALALVPLVLLCTALLVVGLVAIAPWRRHLPLRVRVQRLVSCTVGLLAAYTLLN